jgi:hypothetical protein
MKFIEPRIHAFIDYFVGLMLIAAPALFNFENAIEVFIPALFGLTQVSYSLFTRHEFGFFPVISMRKHLLLDLVMGVVLAASPWIFGFASYIWQPYVVLGGFQVLVALFTKTRLQRRHHRRYRVRPVNEI